MINENEILVLVNGKDNTAKISKIEVLGSKINISFNGSEKLYPYSKQKVLIQDAIMSVDLSANTLFLNGEKLISVIKCISFSTHYKVFYNSGKTLACKKEEIKLIKNVLSDKETKKKLNYLKDLAKCLSNEENDFLDKQYEQIEELEEDNMLGLYLYSPKEKKVNFQGVRIFPFGINLSQEKAVENALTNRTSIIEGPPGTGKTQTILNIIANLVAAQKTVAVVSNNNAAIENIYDKLKSYDLSFFAAVLGNKKNKSSFLENQQEEYPSLGSLVENKKQVQELTLDIGAIRKHLEYHNEKSKLSQEVEALLVEEKYFMEMYEERGVKISLEKYFHMKASTLLSFCADMEFLKLQNKKINLPFKIKIILKYMTNPSSLYSYELEDIIVFLQKCFYVSRKREINTRIEELKRQLELFDFHNKLKEYQEKSMMLFQYRLSKLYNLKEKRIHFSKDFLRNGAKEFMREYPVILSTTHALKSSTPRGIIYDYLIIDEASQVDIVAGGLAMSCAKNVVVVGDTKQLPHIVSREVEGKANEIFKGYSLGEGYHYSKSLLVSITELFKDAPKTLLKEHYRCHPKIIDFCNKKFYSNKLTILTEEKEGDCPLTLFNTTKGNHAKFVHDDGTYNQRQIDVIFNEILPKLESKSIGIIAPYRKQVNKISSLASAQKHIEVDTVHKFQGRERDTIIISSVVSKKNEFADDPNLLNVAISRAKDKLYIIVSDDEQNKNMKDLVNYIRYNNFEITESKIYSIFDLLYKSYSSHLEKHLKSMEIISSHKSENLMNIIIKTVLSRDEFSHLEKILNFPFNKLIKDKSLLEGRELAFAQSPLAHIDFLIYSNIDKQAVLAIEVDGVAFHENNEKQLERDRVKDSILQKYKISILRFATNGSNEEERLVKTLKNILA